MLSPLRTQHPVVGKALFFRRTLQPHPKGFSILKFRGLHLCGSGSGRYFQNAEGAQFWQAEDNAWWVYLPGLTSSNLTERGGSLSDLKSLILSELGAQIETQCRWLRIHAGFFVTGQGGLLLWGLPGAGKSTVAAGLLGDDRVQVFGDEMVWFDGRTIHPMPLPLQPRGQGFVQLNPVDVPNLSSLSVALLFDQPMGRISFLLRIFAGQGLPQMLIYQLSFVRLLQVVRWIPHRLRLALAINRLPRQWLRRGDGAQAVQKVIAGG